MQADQIDPVATDRPAPVYFGADLHSVRGGKVRRLLHKPLLLVCCEARPEVQQKLSPSRGGVVADW
ncbi:hypothetical protein LR032_02435, partial [Candidatus Bipolaricaulota bacterium]|nr:hypothetical protein [Candidatus Bipolaricaulota bacterium]